MTFADWINSSIECVSNKLTIFLRLQTNDFILCFAYDSHTTLFQLITCENYFIYVYSLFNYHMHFVVYMHFKFNFGVFVSFTDRDI